MLWRLGVGPRQADAPAGELGVGRPHLLAGERPSAVDPLAARRQRRQVGASAGLGEQLAPELVGSEDPRQPSLPLLGRAVRQQRGAGEVDPDAVDQLRRAGAGVFGVVKGDVDRRRSPSADLLGP